MPEQADRCTWTVIAAYTQLRLARGLVDDLRLPWERPCDPPKLTPTRVRRGFRRLRAIVRGHEKVPGYGHLRSPLVATKVPAFGHEKSSPLTEVST